MITEMMARALLEALERKSPQQSVLDALDRAQQVLGGGTSLDLKGLDLVDAHLLLRRAITTQQSPHAIGFLRHQIDAMQSAEVESFLQQIDIARDDAAARKAARTEPQAGRMRFKPGWRDAMTARLDVIDAKLMEHA